MLRCIFSRSFYSFETSELHSDHDAGPLKENSLLQYHPNNKGKREGDAATVQLTSKMSKPKPSKFSSRELNGKILRTFGLKITVCTLFQKINRLRL